MQNQLAVLVEKTERANRDPGVVQLFGQTKFGELAYRGRLQIDTYTQRARIFGCLADADTDACLMQAEGRLSGQQCRRLRQSHS